MSEANAESESYLFNFFFCAISFLFAFWDEQHPDAAYLVLLAVECHFLLVSHDSRF